MVGLLESEDAQIAIEPTAHNGYKAAMPRAYSYTRYSSAMQSAEAGGESLARQVSLARKWCAAQNPPVTLDEELHDEISGSKGGHITDGRPLGDFLRRVANREIERHSYLIIETFSRLSRLPIDLGAGIISDLIRADIRFVTLQTGRVYDRASLRRNPGELQGIITLLEAAHNEAATRGDYARWSWGEGGRRKRITYQTPAWIRPSADRGPDGEFPPGTVFELIPERVEVIVLIFALYLAGYGIDRIVRMLNDPRSPNHRPAFMRPTKPGTKPKRKETAERGWYHAYVASILFSRRVLGEIEEAVWVTDETTGKTRAEKTGVVRKLYPEALGADSVAIWNQVQAIKRVGGTAGPTGEDFANLFKGIAKCVCGASMWLVNKGNRSQYRYLLCAEAKRGKCEHRRLHRYAPFEAGMLRMMGVLAYGDLPQQAEESKAHAKLRRDVARAKLDVDDIEARLERQQILLARSGKLSGLDLKFKAKWDAEYDAKVAEHARLQAQLDRIPQAKPLGDQIATVKRLVADMDQEGEQKLGVRGKINTGLKGILREIVFDPNGEITLKFQHSFRDMAYAPDWHFVGVTKQAVLLGRQVNGKLQMTGFTTHRVTDRQYRTQLAEAKQRMATRRCS